jgi:hypothetical protein
MQTPSSIAAPSYREIVAAQFAKRAAEMAAQPAMVTPDEVAATFRAAGIPVAQERIDRIVRCMNAVLVFEGETRLRQAYRLCANAEDTEGRLALSVYEAAMAITQAEAA